MLVDDLSPQTFISTGRKRTADFPNFQNNPALKKERKKEKAASRKYLVIKQFQNSFSEIHLITPFTFSSHLIILGLTPISLW